MNYQHITELLHKYFEGETSLPEEAQLRAYFNAPGVHPALQQYQPLFQFLEQERNQGLNHQFEVRLSEQLQSPRADRRIRYLNRWVLRVAAVALLALGLWRLTFTLPMPKAEPVAAIDWSKYEPETPEEALEITRKALTKVSLTLNEGASTAVKEMGKMKKMTKVLQ